jgi:hypothetical protein
MKSLTFPIRTDWTPGSERARLTVIRFVFGDGFDSFSAILSYMMARDILVRARYQECLDNQERTLRRPCSQIP